MRQSIIIDNDGCADILHQAAVLLASDKFEMLGATCSFGNSTVENTVENTLRILSFIGHASVPVYKGGAKPSDSQLLEGDGAHGFDGIGGIKLPKSNANVEGQNAVDFILETLKKRDADTVTILASSPQINLANAIRRDPKTMSKVKQIVIMGGCIESMEAKDFPERCGNITKF